MPYKDPAKEKARQQRRQADPSHKAKERARQGQRQSDPKYVAYHRSYYAANKDKWVARSKLLNKTDNESPEARDRRLAASRKYARENRQRLNEYRRNYYATVSRDRLFAKRATPEYKEWQRNYRRKRDYGVTPEQYAELAKAQRGNCAICGDVLAINTRMTHIDHNHETGAVRGLLCHHCNTMIGHAREKAATLRSAIAYLRKHKAK